MSLPRLTQAQSDLLETGCASLYLASRNTRRVPSLTRGVDARLDENQEQVTILVLRSQSQQVLRDIASTHAAALVVSRPSTHLTFQLKGHDARETALPADAEYRARQHREAFARELAIYGYPPAFAMAVYGFQPDDLVAVTFTVSALFEQTPGPGTGTRMTETVP